MIRQSDNQRADQAPQDEGAILQNAPIDPNPRPADPDQAYHVALAWIWLICVIGGSAALIALKAWTDRPGGIWP